MAPTFSNSQKLAAVLNLWVSPLVNQLISSNISAFPFIANIESKVRSTGWVSPQWSLSDELAPVLNGVAGILIEPLLAKYIGNIPDSAIPQFAHGFVANAISGNKDLMLFEGKVRITRSDLADLKRLLDYNLPLSEGASYEVIVNQTKDK